MDQDGPRWTKTDQNGPGRTMTDHNGPGWTRIMAVWVVEFSNKGYKLERFSLKNQHTQRKLLNFENWVNGEV